MITIDHCLILTVQCLCLNLWWTKPIVKQKMPHIRKPLQQKHQYFMTQKHRYSITKIQLPILISCSAVICSVFESRMNQDNVVINCESKPLKSFPLDYKGPDGHADLIFRYASILNIFPGQSVSHSLGYSANRSFGLAYIRGLWACSLLVWAGI